MTTLTASQAVDLFRQPPLRHLDVDGGQVAYRRVGAGPDVLFVHGWPVSGATFRQLLPHLAPHVTCHIIDLIGAGQSRFDRSSPIDLPHHAASIRRVVDTLGLTDVALVGHDSGGLLARHAMAGDPRLRAMVLIDTEQPQGLTWRFRQLLWMMKLPGAVPLLGWAGMQRGLRRSPLLLGGCFADQGLLDGEFEEFFLAPLRDDAGRRWAAGRLARRFDPRWVTELAAVHRRLTVPVRLIWGQGDPYFPVELARDMLATFPDARLQVVAGTRLFCHEERPAEVAAGMLPTLLAGRQDARSPRAEHP